MEKANAAAEDDDDDEEAPATPPAAASPSTPPPRGSPNGSDGGAALERWRGATQRLIDEAFTAHTKARQWRLEMSRETEAAEGAGRAAFAHVTREIKRHVQAAAQQAASMYTRQLSFDGRLNQLRADRRALERAKIARAAPLKAAKQTMQKRAQRPAAEQVAPRRPRVEPGAQLSLPLRLSAGCSPPAPLLPPQVDDAIGEMLALQYEELLDSQAVLERRLQATVDGMADGQRQAAALVAEAAAKAEELALAQEILRVRQDWREPRGVIRPARSR